MITAITYDKDNICSDKAYQAFERKNKFISWPIFKAEYLKIIDRFANRFRANARKENDNITRYFRYNLTPEIICPELETGSGIIAKGKSDGKSNMEVSSGVIIN